MKKMFSLLLAAVMLVSGACVFAEDTDSIFGQWFVSYVVVSAGVVSAPGDAGFSQDLVINEGGDCVFNMCDYNGNSSTASGTWIVNDSGMTELEFDSGIKMLVQVIGDVLVACDSEGNTYYCYRDMANTQQLIPFTGYSEDAVDADFFGDWVCEAMLFNAADGSRQYYSRHILGLDFAVSIGINEEVGGYSTDWHIGGVGAEMYNEDVQTIGSYGVDEYGDVMMNTTLNLSNGISSQVFIYMDSSLETLHVYGIYGTLVFVRAENAQERPQVLVEAYNQDN
jgi:hypothetical protein